MTRDLLKNIEFIDILSRRSGTAEASNLSIRNYTSKEDCISSYKNNGFFSYGYHPWHLDQDSDELCSLHDLISSSKCLAIGETGIDRVNLSYSLKEQLSSFHKHIELSEQIQKPLIIHCVKGYSELLEAYKRYSPTQSWIIHDFNHNKDFLNAIRTKRIYISLGRNFFERKNSKVNKATKDIELEKLFFETDEMNIEIYEVYKKFCDNTELEMKELKKNIKTNFEKVFMP